MRSSYLRNHYDGLIEAITRVHKPRTIVEFGILDGLSLDALFDGAPGAQIIAYDLFGDFVGNHSNEAEIRDRYGSAGFGNIQIQHGDFYKQHAELPDHSIDLLHVDVANDGSVYDFVFRNYMSKLSVGGLVLLEGGSRERDQVEWLKKYNKPPIGPVLDNCRHPHFTFAPFPSLTVVYA